MCTMAEAGDKLTKQVGAIITLAVKDELLQPIERFEKALAASDKAIYAWKDASWYSYLMWGLIALMTCLCVSFVTVKIFLPTPTTPFTDEQLKTYGNGKFIEKVLDKMSPEEVEHLDAIGKRENAKRFGTALVDTTKEKTRKNVHVNKQTEYKRKHLESAEQGAEDII